MAACAVRLDAAPFEDLGAGARAPGMGNAFSAIADDVYAIHYNPAGLATLERPELGLTYSRLYLGLSDNSNLGENDIAYAHPLKQGRRGTLGVGWSNFGLNSIYNERTFGLSYGHRAWEHPGKSTLYWGISLKNLNRSFSPGPEAGNAFDGNFNVTGAADPALSGKHSKTANGFDVGFLYRTPRRYSVSLAILNLNQPDVGVSASDKVPMRTRLGVSYKSLWMNLSTELQREKSATGGTDNNFVAAGEKVFPSLDRGELGVRGGLAVGAREYRQLSLGLTYKINKIQADYAFIMPFGGVSGTAGTHRLGMSFHFGALTTEELYSNELMSQMQRLREKQATGAGYEFTELSKPANLDRPELRVVREKIEAGEFLTAHQVLLHMMTENPPDDGLTHLAKRLDVVAAFFPDLSHPAEKWETVAANGGRAFLYGKDRTAMLLVSYAASLAPKQLKLDKFLQRLESSTYIAADKPSKPGRTLLEDKHARAQEAFATKDYQMALDETRDALELEPDDVKAQKRVGTSLFLLGYYPEAISAWESALRLEQAPSERAAIEHYLSKAREALASGQGPTKPLAPRKTRRIVPTAPAGAPAGAADPRLIERLYQRGMEHYARGEMVLAVAAFQRILAMDPENGPARKALERIRRSER